jgi:hypothetical protein
MTNPSSSSAPLYFASGSNRACEIRAFSRIGQPIGVAATEVGPTAEAALVALAGTGTPVFVDSGAFGEVQFDPAQGKLVVVKPITDEDWQRILGLYERLATALGSQLHVVAPDAVGCQATTLARLNRYAASMRRLRALGASILVPLQRGLLTLAELDEGVTAELGFDDYVRSLPCKKGATTDDEIRAFLATRPARLHLLGMGPRNRRMPRVLAMLAELSPDTELSCDSNLITASVGRKPRPRLLTAARDRAARLIAAGRSAVTDVQEAGILLAWGDATMLRA